MTRQSRTANSLCPGSCHVLPSWHVDSSLTARPLISAISKQNGPDPSPPFSASLPAYTTSSASSRRSSSVDTPWRPCTGYWMMAEIWRIWRTMRRSVRFRFVDRATADTADNLRLLATEVRDFVQNKIGPTDFSQVWESLRKKVRETREGRREEKNRMVRRSCSLVTLAANMADNFSGRGRSSSLGR